MMNDFGGNEWWVGVKHLIIELEYTKDADGNLVANISHLSDEEKYALLAAIQQLDEQPVLPKKLIKWTGVAGDCRFDNPDNWEGGVVPASAEEIECKPIPDHLRYKYEPS